MVSPPLAACGRLTLPCPSELHYFPLQIFAVAGGEWSLLDFQHQCREVSKSSYRLSQTAIEPGNIFSDGSHQHCTLYRLQWDSAALEILSKLRISRTEGPDRAADGDKAVFHCLDITIANLSLDTLNLFRAAIGPVVISNLEARPVVLVFC